MTGTRSIWPLMTVLLLVGAAAIGTMAQDAEKKPARKPADRQEIALLDVSYIYKNYPRFKEKMAEMKLEVDRVEAEFKQKKKEVEDMAKQLGLRNLGTPEHTELETKIGEKGSPAGLKKILMSARKWKKNRRRSLDYLMFR